MAGPNAIAGVSGVMFGGVGLSGIAGSVALLACLRPEEQLCRKMEPLARAQLSGRSFDIEQRELRPGADKGESSDGGAWGLREFGERLVVARDSAPPSTERHRPGSWGVGGAQREEQTQKPFSRQTPRLVSSCR